MYNSNTTREYLESIGCKFMPLGKYSIDHAFDLDGNVVAEHNENTSIWTKFPNSPDTRFRFRIRAPSVPETPEEIERLLKFSFLANH